VRGLPAILYVSAVGRRHALASGLLLATSLPFIVAATQIGLALKVIQPSTGAALVAAGLVSVVAFPVLALALAGSGDGQKEAEEVGDGTALVDPSPP
jgi:Kef-type K+ transport system membrane component KefB